MNASGINVDFASRPQCLFGRYMPRYVVGVIFHRLLLQKSKLPLQRSLPVNPEIPLMLSFAYLYANEQDRSMQLNFYSPFSFHRTDSGVFLRGSIF